MKILLLEDNKELSENIKDYLQISQNWKIDTAFDLKQAKEKFESDYYDILLFDVMLPDWESYELAKELKKDYDVPIIFLTAKWELEDKLLWFDSWWDDYITKPFQMEELIARIKALAKRFWIWNLQVKWVDIDLENKSFKKEWKEISLNKTEIAILDYLLTNRNKVIWRDELIEYVWGDEWAWDEKVDRKLDVYISNIRKKLWKDFIETIKWVGYKI